mgnify:CR=1 FL=1
MDTRDALLDSAEMSCRRRGFDGFSYADMAKDVNIRKASIHHHFPLKADLALALLDRYSRNFFSALDQISVSKGDAGDKLVRYVALYRQALNGGQSVCLCVALSAGRASLTDEVVIKLNSFHDESIKWLAQLFETAAKDRSINHVIDCTSEAAATLAIMEGAPHAIRSD